MVRRHIVLISMSGLMVLDFNSCRPRDPSSTKDAVDNMGINFVEAGKGYKPDANEVTSSFCVESGTKIAIPSGDNSGGGPFGPGNSGGTNPFGPNTNPVGPSGSSTGPSNLSGGGGNPFDLPRGPSGPMGVGTPAPQSDPGGSGLFPSSKPDGNKSGNINPFDDGKMGSTFGGRNVSDIGVSNGLFDSPGTASLTNNNPAASGETKLEFTLHSNLRSVYAMIEASYIGSGKKDLAGDGQNPVSKGFSAKIEVNSNKESVYILLHGRKTFKPDVADFIQTPVFSQNVDLQKAIFGTLDFPKDPAEQKKYLEEAYGQLKVKCGTQFVQGVIRGREIWMLATFDKSNLSVAANAKLSAGEKADLGSDSANKKGIEGGFKAEFLKQKVQFFVHARGKNDVKPTGFTIDQAIAEVGDFLTKNSTGQEHVLMMDVPNDGYDQVTFKFNDGVVKTGNQLFTNNIKKVSDTAVVVLRKDLTWASGLINKMYHNYDWDQWTWDEAAKTGVGMDYARLYQDYDLAINKVFKNCGGPNANFDSLSTECQQEIAGLASRIRLKIDLPAPTGSAMHIWMPGDSIKAMRDRKLDNDKVRFSSAKKTCEKTPGFRLPSLDDWKRIIASSANFILWQKLADKSYNPLRDEAHLAYPCGGFKDSYLWTDVEGEVAGIPASCNPQEVTKLYFKPTTFYVDRAHFVCISFEKKELMQ